MPCRYYSAPTPQGPATAYSGLAWNLIKRAITRTLQAVKELLVEMNHVWMLDAYVIPTDEELLIVHDTYGAF
jgi:hypothetical protein